jgi:hypothetical protein
MSSRTGLVFTWSSYLALGIACLATRQYWLAAAYMCFGVIWFLRGAEASRLDDLSSDTLGLKPQRRTLFTPDNIFTQS